MVIQLCSGHGLEICAADAKGIVISELPVRPPDFGGFCLAVGSESNGVQPELLSQCLQVALPMSEMVNSLNAGVAGGVLMHALACAWGRRSLDTSRPILE